MHCLPALPPLPPVAMPRVSHIPGTWRHLRRQCSAAYGTAAGRKAGQLHLVLVHRVSSSSVLLLRPAAPFFEQWLALPSLMPPVDRIAAGKPQRGSSRIRAVSPTKSAALLGTHAILDSSEADTPNGERKGFVLSIIKLGFLKNGIFKTPGQ
jgi:hypothetical protein